jgi:hypothetical protein
MQTMKTLKPAFTKANKYLFDPSAYSRSLPSGTSCPFALKCLAAASRSTGKIISGPRQEFKCYSAQYERYPSVRARVWANLDAVRGLNPNEVCDLLDSVKPTKAKLIRVHSGGDFFSQDYFDGWLKFVSKYEDCWFWAFTKSIPYWVNRIDSIPDNLNMIASYGGKRDDLIEAHNLRSALVTYSTGEAEEAGLPVDTDDRIAAYGKTNFALIEKKAARREAATKAKKEPTHEEAT